MAATRTEELYSEHKRLAVSHGEYMQNLSRTAQFADINRCAPNPNPVILEASAEYQLYLRRRIDETLSVKDVAKAGEFLKRFDEHVNGPEKKY